MAEEISFPMPEGFAPPEDSKPGEPFDVLATVRLDGDMLVLTAIDGSPVGAGEDEQPEMPEDDAGFLGAVERGMAAE